MGVTVLILLKPYSNVKPYLDTVFNQSNTRTNGDSQVNFFQNEDLDLNIQEVEIEEPVPSDDSNSSSTETKVTKHTFIYPYYGDRYATLNIENAGMKDLPVYCGTDESLLEMGVGWYNGSVYIGKVGNVVLAAHNHTYFYMLPAVKVGDIVTLETSYVKMTYIVSDIVVFHETDYTYVLPTKGKDRLTMYTCWNNGYLGMSEWRLGVLCDLVSREWKEVEVPQ